MNLDRLKTKQLSAATEAIVAAASAGGNLGYVEAIWFGANPDDNIGAVEHIFSRYVGKGHLVHTGRATAWLMARQSMDREYDALSCRELNNLLQGFIGRSCRSLGEEEAMQVAATPFKMDILRACTKTGLLSAIEPNAPQSRSSTWKFKPTEKGLIQVKCMETIGSLVAIFANSRFGDELDLSSLPPDLLDLFIEVVTRVEQVRRREYLSIAEHILDVNRALVYVFGNGSAIQSKRITFPWKRAARAVTDSTLEKDRVIRELALTLVNLVNRAVAANKELAINKAAS